MMRSLISAVLVLFTVATSSAAAHDLPDLRADFANLEEGEEFAAYFRAHATVQSEAEQQLPNGVRWRLLLDTRTGTRMPRLVSVTAQQRMARVNRFLEMSHGRAISQADDYGRIWLGNNTIRRTVHHLPPHVPRPLQSHVQLTYATSQFVQFIEFHVMEDENGERSERWNGKLFDVWKGIVVSLRCPRPKPGDQSARFWIPDPPGIFFSCKDFPRQSFLEVVRQWALRGIPVEERNAPPQLDGCHRIAHRLARQDVDIEAYLTSAGLALLEADLRLPAAPIKCASGLPYGDPVVVPYRDLVPFIQRGALRDELLK